MPGAGGVENVAWQVAHELARQGEDVTVLAREIAPTATVAAEPITAPRAWQPARIEVFSRRCAARLAGRDFDVVHGFSHTRTQDLFRAGGGSHREWLRRTHRGVAHTLRRGSPRYRVRFAVERDVFERSRQRIQCPSRLVADTLEREHGVSAGRILLLPNAVDAARFAPAATAEAGARFRREVDPEAACIWLLPGSGWQRKGLDTALRALARGDRGDRLWVAGRDAPQPWRARARALGVADRVRFLGPRDDLPRIYAAADAIVLPTRYDPFANVTIEAAAAARPIVTTRTNGASEWFGEALTALEDPDDDLGLSAALAGLRGSEERQRRGDALAEQARALDWPGHVRALRDEYAAIVERRARADA